MLGCGPADQSEAIQVVRAPLDTAVTVTVTDDEDEPMEGVTVVGLNADDEEAAWSSTDGSGEAAFMLPSGLWRFKAMLGGTGFASGSPGHCSVPTCTSAVIEVPRPVVLTVTNPASEPLEGLTVAAIDSEANEVAWQDTDAAGIATIYVHPGSYRFVTMSGLGHYFSGSPGHCEVPGCTEASVVVQDPVRVFVQDPIGRTTDILAVALNADNEEVEWESPDESGVATFYPQAGAYRFRATLSGTNFYSGEAEHCSLPTCKVASILIPPPVIVSVTNGEGTPIAEKLVAAGDGSDTEVAWLYTDELGQAAFYLHPGDHRFWTQRDDTRYQSGPPGHCHVATDCTEAQIVINPILVTVVDTAEQALSGREVWASNELGEIVARATTDAYGVAEIWAGLGTYLFSTYVGPNRFRSGSVPHCTYPGCYSATITVNAPVTVTVQDPLGNPIANQSVLAMTDDACLEEVYADTDNDGHASFTLPDGAWRFRANCGCEAFYSGSIGHCVLPGCTAATVTMVCGTCTGQPNGTTCNDQNACTQTSTCQDGACVGSNPITCTALDQCHVAGTCDSATGTCSNPAKPEGTDCDDSNACSQLDTCVAGACTGGDLVICTASDQCHAPGSCNTSTGACSNPAKENGASCDDGNACTRVDTCVSGTCTGGSSVTCTALDQCHDAGSCNTATGGCSNPAKSNGTSCSDGNACTTSDTCQSGLCTGGGAVTCVASDQCHTAGTCNPGTGTCTAEVAKTNGSACDDGDACTRTDTCQGGECNGTNAVVCVAQDQCHEAGTCNTSTGACSNPNKTNGTACNDGSLCTSGDTCQSGTCTGATTVTCVASNQCRSAGTCNPATGVCSNPAKTNGSSCDDGNSCTSGDTCQSGACTAGTGSCAIVAVSESIAGNQSSNRIQLSVTHSADKTQVVPGDPIVLTATVTNNGLNLVFGGGALSIRNVSSTAYTVHGYKQTMEYFSPSTQTWIPFAQVGRNNSGTALSTSSPLVPISPYRADIVAQNGVTYPTGSETIYGAVIQPNAVGVWTWSGGVAIPAATVAAVFGAGQAAGFRIAFHVDTSEVSTGTEAVGSQNMVDLLDGTDGAVYDPAVAVAFTQIGAGTANLTPTSRDPIPAGGSRVFSDTVPAPALAPRKLGEGEGAYIGRLSGQYQLRTTASGSSLKGPIPSRDANPAIFLTAKVPVIVPTASGDSEVPAGFTKSIDVSLLNQGGSTAGPFFLQDSVAGVPVAATVTTPATVATNHAATATVEYQVPLGRAAGSMTDTISVVWEDSNHNPYGPVSASFTTTVTPADLDGNIVLSGAVSSPDVIGTTKSLTATVTDEHGDPVASLAVQLVVSGPNARTLSGTTGLDGKVTFTYSGTNRGQDVAVATATIIATPVSSNAAGVNWVTADVTPCTGATTPMDIVLVIDNSASMAGDGKMEAARAAAKNFVDSLDLARDQVAVLAFNPPAAPLARLGRNATLAKQAIDSIFVPEWFAPSDIAAALKGAKAELTSNLHNSSATRVVVLLSDGMQSTFDDAATAKTKYEAAITDLKSPSIPIRAVALAFGPEVDGVHMRQIASSASDYFYAPRAEDVAWAYTLIGHDLCRNLPPLVRAGGDAGAYGVRLPATLTLEGEVHDDGPPERLEIHWAQVSGPADATIVSPDSAVTEVVFTDPGTYVFELTGSDGFMTAGDRATVTVDTEPSLSGASIGVALSAAGPLTIGTNETLTATLLDGSSQPIANFPVKVDITGANPQSAVLITNASGVATYTYKGVLNGTDTLSATALGSTPLTSSSVTVSWNLPSGSGPTVTQGWIGSPANNATLTGQVPITIASGTTLTGGSLSYWPASSPSAVTTLVASGITGTGGSTIATFDTTLLANGPYVIKLEGTASGGATKNSLIGVTVAGDYKPGRVVVELTDFSIPLPGLPITIGRRYDSLERDRIGDFGYGWSLVVGHPRLEVDAGKNVTFTMPNGRRSTFQFAPTFPVVGPVIFGFFLLPAYTPAPGVYGSLTTDGCGLLMFDPFAQNPNPICFASLFDPEHLAYEPETYTYTDPYGTVYVMGADGKLKSIRDRQNNTLTFSDSGIVSSSGDLTVTFTRDGSHRITEIRTPIFDLGGGFFAHTYQYDGSGNLSAYLNPENMATRHTYDSTHLLLTTKDPRGNMARTSTYDGSGRLASDTDALGNVTSYAYTLATRTTTQTNPDTGVVTRVFDAQGMLLSETDPLSRVTSHTYDSNRNELTMTNAAGEVTSHTYDSRGNQLTTTQTIDGTSRTTTVTYDLFGQRLTSTNPYGHVNTTAYDGKGLPTTSSDSTGTRATFTSSTTGLPLSVTDADGKTRYFTYDAFGNLATTTDRLSRFTKHEYDGIGRRFATTDPRGGRTVFIYYNRGPLKMKRDPLGYEHRYVYDQNNNLTFEEIGGYLQGRRTYRYDALNHLTDVEHADRTHTQYTRDFRGNPLTETDQLGRVTTYEYDHAGQLTKTTYPDATFKTRTYDDLGRLETETDERGNTTTYEYQPGSGAADRITSITDGLGRETTMTYDALGRKTSATDGAGHTTSYVYDGRGHLTETHYQDSTVSYDAYDTRGRHTSTTDQTSATTTYGYDDEGQLTSVTDALSHVTNYTYDEAGNLKTVRDARNNTTSYEYDLLNRKTKRTLPLGMSETFTYAATDPPRAHTDFRGKTTTMTYDVLDRLLARIPDPSLLEQTESYTYFATGTRASMTDASGLTTYTYDSRNRVLTKATPAGTLTYTYDDAGNVATVRSSNTNGTSVDYAWDEANQLESVTDNRLGGVTTAAYTQTGKPDTLAQPNGVNATYAYSSMDRVTSVSWKLGSGSPFATWSYGYNARGQRTNSTEISGRAAAYGYDAASRLTSETISSDPRGSTWNGAVSYTIDNVGNRNSRTVASTATGLATVLPNQTGITYNTNDQISGDTFDLNGNTTGSGGVVYSYDYLDRLKKKNPGTSGEVELTYDCDGNRVAKTVSGTTTRYLVDDLNPTGYVQVLEEVPGGAVQVRYTYGTSVVSQTRSPGGANVTSFYGYDAHGNVTFLTDATGATTDTYNYDAWGNLVVGTGTTVNSRLYVGEELDADLGFLNLRARQYRATTGRFLRLDPSFGRQDAPHSLHKYLYAEADPITFVDPTGLAVAVETGLIDVAVALRNTAIILATGYASVCNLAFGLSAFDLIDGSSSVPGPWKWCARKKEEDCREKFRGKCDAECTHLMGENYRPGRPKGPRGGRARRGGGTNTQIKYTNCVNDCLDDMCGGGDGGDGGGGGGGSDSN